MGAISQKSAEFLLRSRLAEAAAGADGERMVSGVERIAIAFDSNDDVRMAPKPRRLEAKRGLGRRSENCAFAAEIDRRAARLSGEVGTQRVDPLQHRLLGLRIA